MRLLCFCVLLFALLAGSAQSSQPVITTILYRQCDSDFEFLADTPFAFQLHTGLIENLINEAINFTKNRANCECPGHPSQDFDVLFDPVTALMNMLTWGSFRPSQTSCLVRSFPRNSQLMDIMRLTLPSTCTYDTWARTGTCFLKLPLADLHLAYQLGIKKCANSALPAISLDCEGEGCKTFGKPCFNDADCDGTGWTSPCTFPDYAQGFPYEFFLKLQDASFFPPEVAPPGCYQRPATPSTRNPNNDFSSALMTYVAREFGLQGTFIDPKVCGFYEFYNRGPGKSLRELTTDYWDVYLNKTGPLKCWQPPDNPSYGSNATRIAEVTTTALVDWNGTITNGTPSFDRQPYLPPQPFNEVINSNQRRLMETTCDGQVQAHMWGQRLSMKMSSFKKHFEFGVDLLYRAMKCEVFPEFSREQFNARFGLWEPLLHLLQFDGYANYPGANVPSFTDYRTLFYKMVNAKIWNLPSSCKFDSYQKNFTCAIDWFALQSILHMDITIRIRAKQCNVSANSALAAYTVDCVGTDCPALFDGLKPCSTSSDCPSASQQCIDVPALLDSLYNTAIQDDDWFDYYFGGDNIDKQNICMNVPFNSRSSNVEFACSGPSKFWSQLTSSAVHLFGGKFGSNPPSNSIQFSFCSPNRAIFSQQAWKDWVNTLITPVVGRNEDYLLNHIRAAPLEDEVAPPAAPTPTGGGGTEMPVTNPGLSTTAIIAISASVGGVVLLAAVAAMVVLKKKKKHYYDTPLLSDTD